MSTYTQTIPQTLAVQIGPKCYFDESGGIDDLVNHSCDPNVGLLVRGAAVELRAVRDVRADEQVTFDYSTTMDEDDFEFDCLCGSPLCRRRVGDFMRLPASEAYPTSSHPVSENPDYFPPM